MITAARIIMTIGSRTMATETGSRVTEMIRRGLHLIAIIMVDSAAEIQDIIPHLTVRVTRRDVLMEMIGDITRIQVDTQRKILITSLAKTMIPTLPSGA